MVLPLIAMAAGRIAMGAAARAGAGAVAQRAAGFGGQALAQSAISPARNKVPGARAAQAGAMMSGPNLLSSASNQFSSLLQPGQFQ